MSNQPTPQINTSPAVKPFIKHSKAIIIFLNLTWILAIAFIAIQLIPVQRTNPPVIAQLSWDSQQTRDLAYRACMDCHSNETKWPWYAHVAPTSWLLYYDVTSARSGFDLSTYPSSMATAGTDPAGDLAYQFGQFLATLGQPQDHGGAAGQAPMPSDGQGVALLPVHNLGDELTEHIDGGEMPPSKYLLMHPAARLTAEDRQQLLQGLLKTLGLTTAE